MTKLDVFLMRALILLMSLVVLSFIGVYVCGYASSAIYGIIRGNGNWIVNLWIYSFVIWFIGALFISKKIARRLVHE